MNDFKLARLRELSGLFNEHLAMIGDYLTRTCAVSVQEGSQGEEDKILRELLTGDGGYVDFGAGRPRNNSNTLAFWERGWRGLLVEPYGGFIVGLNLRRYGDKVYPAAVRNYTGQTLFYPRGEVSSVNKEWGQGEPDPETAPRLVSCETTTEMLAKFPQERDACRFCSIDVEGAERELLETIDWATFHPEVFCIEYREYDPVKLGEDISGGWLPLLTAQGYKEVARTQLNIIFQKET